MLVGTVDRRVHRYLPIDLSEVIGLCQKHPVNPVPGPVPAQATVTFPDCLPRSELRRQVPSRNPAPVPVDDALNNLAMIAERPAPLLSAPVEK